MSEPKVPSWMEERWDGCPGWSTPGPQFGDETIVCYQPGDDSALIEGYMTAQQLRELADLIDSCQEPSDD